MSEQGSRLLEIRDLRVAFRSPGAPPALAVDDLRLDLGRGESLAVLGESGSGKTACALAIAGLLPGSAAVSGSVRLDGDELLGASEPLLRRVRGGRIGLVYQEPSSALDPVMPVGEQVAESARAHGRDRKLARYNALSALDSAGIPDPERLYAAYPHELSGGLRQRACIAMAIVNRPALLIADEPTSALDVSVRAGILELLAELRRAFGMALLVITHDLQVAARAAERAMVLYAGRAVECGPLDRLLERPLHPYTRALLAASPRLGAGRVRLAEVPGSVPSASAVLPGCRFAPRCPLCQEACRSRRPTLREVLPGHEAACHLAGRSAAGSPPLPEIRL
jgi:oligopeptide/dipeptide ABC transporter ATP-binding protein